MNRWTVLLLLLAIAVIVAWKLFSSDTEPDASDTSVPAVQQVTQPLTGPNAATSDPAAFTASPLQFTSMRETSDIDFVHVSGDSAEKPFPAANGSGIAALDYDLDGNVDLYFATGTTLPTDPARENPTNRCYRNLGGWQFQDVTDLCGLGHNGYSAGLAVGDFNSDGFPDVYVTCFGENQLYQNRGDGTFQVVTEQSGTGDMRWATSAACMDYDNDGLTDLYVCNYGIWSLATNQFCGDRERDVRIFCSPGSVPAERDVLFHNEGDGSFRDVTMETGLGASAGRKVDFSKTTEFLM
ncbi:MAG TPA: VCBS repeat-containing protein [Fuerstia sp.]|nr:VCBS repeat-containing protein [Fuerstiella sp.]